MNLGLLGQGWDDPRSAAIMALAGGLLQGNAGMGLLAGSQAFQQATQAKKQGLLDDLKMKELQAIISDREATTQQKRDAAERAKRIQDEAPNLFTPAGYSGGEAVPQEMGGIPMFSQPMGVAPMQRQPGGFDVQRALRLRMNPDEIKAYSGLADIGRPEVARVEETTDAQNRPVKRQLDKFGNPVGGDLGVWKPPTMQNLGNRVVAIDPVSRDELGSFAMGQSPDSQASNAVQWANYNLAKQRLQMEQDAPKGTYDPERGVIVDTRNGVASPVMQGGQPIGPKNKEMTDAQAKANLFGSRAMEANRILGSLQGKYWPGAINSKTSAENLPIVGGTAGYIGNKMLSEAGQQAEQAQRDFINAVLRRESGAVISQPEFDNAKRQYFPQPGDDPKTIAQKARNRQIAVEGIMAEVPSGRRGLPSLTNPTGSPFGNGREAGGPIGTENDPLGIRR